MPLHQAISGGEEHLGFAKNRLSELLKQSKDTGASSLIRSYEMQDGSTVIVRVSGDQQHIVINGGGFDAITSKIYANGYAGINVSAKCTYRSKITKQYTTPDGQTVNAGINDSVGEHVFDAIALGDGQFLDHTAMLTSSNDSFNTELYSVKTVKGRLIQSLLTWQGQSYTHFGQGIIPNIRTLMFNIGEKKNQDGTVQKNFGIFAQATQGGSELVSFLRYNSTAGTFESLPFPSFGQIGTPTPVACCSTSNGAFLTIVFPNTVYAYPQSTNAIPYFAKFTQYGESYQLIPAMMFVNNIKYGGGLAFTAKHMSDTFTLGASMLKSTSFEPSLTYIGNDTVVMSCSMQDRVYSDAIGTIDTGQSSIENCIFLSRDAGTTWELKKNHPFTSINSQSSSYKLSAYYMVTRFDQRANRSFGDGCFYCFFSNATEDATYYPDNTNSFGHIKSGANTVLMYTTDYCDTWTVVPLIDMFGENAMSIDFETLRCLKPRILNTDGTTTEPEFVVMQRHVDNINNGNLTITNHRVWTCKGLFTNWKIGGSIPNPKELLTYYNYSPCWLKYKGKLLEANPAFPSLYKLPAS